MVWGFGEKGNLRSWLGCEEEPQCISVLPQLPLVDASESLQAAGTLLHCQVTAGRAEKHSADAKSGCRWARGRSEVCVCVCSSAPQSTASWFVHISWGFILVHKSAPLWGLWLHPRGSTHHQAVDVPLVSPSVK